MTTVRRGRIMGYTLEPVWDEPGYVLWRHVDYGEGYTECTPVVRSRFRWWLRLTRGHLLGFGWRASHEAQPVDEGTA